MHRGDVRTAILALLTEEPMHGYQIMQELIERSGGVWQPSPGSVYPSLQQLADEGLVTSHDQEGRKIFVLTEDGNAAAAAATQAGTPPWERMAETAGIRDLHEAVFSVGAATKQVARNGGEEQIEKAAEILVDARKRLYQLLAE